MYEIAIIGLGYVGLPLAIEFGKKNRTIGFDLNPSRIYELKNGIDHTLEVSQKEFKNSANLNFTSNAEDIKDCNIFIITVPTPINNQKDPDLSFIEKSSEIVGRVLDKNDIVIYESTVFPGATEEVCVPILENYSGLIFNHDFYCGYSPERINPGDKKHKLVDIIKVTSGSTPEVAKKVDDLYKSIITAGTFKATSIKVAEAAKVIENTQRDVNIALINELSIIFDKLNIDTEEVLEAAGTKWNFLPFRPGLVGGHCIGVDPYYLTHKSIQAGHEPKMILAGRKINDSMGLIVSKRVVSLMSLRNIKLVGANFLVMGLSFKENCPDIRNTKVVDIINELIHLKANVDVFDPWVDHFEAKKEYEISTINNPIKGKYDAIILAVSHSQFINLGIKKIRQFGKKNHIVYDIKYIFQAHEVDGRL